MNRIILVVFLIVQVALPCQAATLHVGSGQTYTAIGDAINAMGSGDTIVVHFAEYYEQNLAPKVGLDNTHRSTIMGAPGEAMPIIHGPTTAAFHIPTFNLSKSYLTLYGLDIRGGGGYECGSGVCIGYDTEATYITVQNCKIGGAYYDSGDGSGQIWLSYGGHISHILITSNEFYGDGTNQGFGVKGCTDDAALDIDINKNYFHNLMEATYIKWGNDTDKQIKFRNNLIDGSTSSLPGIQIDQNLVSITNNVFKTCIYPIRLGSNWCGTGCTVTHNTIYGATYAYFLEAVVSTSSIPNQCFGAKSACDNTFLYNIRYSNSTVSNNGDNNTYAGDFTANPLFTNAASGDFSLGAGSGAIGTAGDGHDYGADLTLVYGYASPAGGSIGSVLIAPGGMSVIRAAGGMTVQ